MTIFSSGAPPSSADADQLAVDQGKIGIWKRGARQYRIGGSIDGDVDKVDLARLLVGAAVGKQQRRLDAGDVDALAGLLGAAGIRAGLPESVTYIGSWLTMTVSGPLCGVTTLPFVMLVLPTLPAIGETISV